MIEMVSIFICVFVNDYVFGDNIGVVYDIVV